MWIGGTTALVTGSIQPIAWAASDAAVTFFLLVIVSPTLRQAYAECLYRIAVYALRVVVSSFFRGREGPQSANRVAAQSIKDQPHGRRNVDYDTVASAT